MRLACLVLAVGLGACGGGAVAPAEAPAPPARTTGAVMPAYSLAAHPDLRISVEAPSGAPYRASVLGTSPQTVELTFGNVGPDPIDLSGLRVAFDVRRGAVKIACAARDDWPKREVVMLAPGRRTTLARELCSLPLPGKYAVDVRVGLATDAGTERAGAFGFRVTAAGPNQPHEVDGHPSIFAALGGNLSGVRFTRSEWRSGAYHVVVRLTNAGTTPVHLASPAEIVFRVTQQGHPLACSATYDLPLPGAIAAGESATRTVPVTCVVDVQGKYDIEATLTMGGRETRLGELSVEVTNNPLLYLPILPW